MDLVNELTEHKTLVIKDFNEVELTFTNIKVKANKCVLYDNAGIIFYLNNEEVLFIEGKAEIIHDKRQDKHVSFMYYIKIVDKSDRETLLYLNKDKDEKILNVDDIVMIKENDIPFGLSLLFANEEEKFKKDEQIIIKEFGYQVKELINNKIVKISKDKSVMYQPISNVIRLKEIKENGKKFREMKKDK